MPELDLFSSATVLEMGACHGWANVMVKVKNLLAVMLWQVIMSQKWLNTLKNGKTCLALN